MQKNILMISLAYKKFCLPFIILLLLFSFNGCRKKKSDAVIPVNTQLQEFCFQCLQYSVTGNTDIPEVKKFIFPQQMKNMMLQRVCKNGQYLYAYEVIYPECSGLLQTQNYYVPDFDDGQWVDEIINQSEEERIADELESLQELDKIIKAPYSKENLNVDPVENRLTDSNNRLKIMEYGKEVFIPVEGSDKLEFINKSDSKVSRNIFDSKYRIITKEVWSIPDVENAVLKLKEEYSYMDDSAVPFKKISTTSEGKNIVYYNTKGLTQKTESYETGKTDKLISSFAYTYDDKDRVTSEEVRDYTVKPVVIKKQVYIYNQNEELPPDYEYYENEELKTSTVYEAKGVYVTTIHFDKEYYVKTYYKDFAKIKDVYYAGEQVIREKIYEQ